MLVSKDSENGKEEYMDVSKGDCVHIPSGVSHVFYAITDCNLATFLTKKWDDCKVAIVHENLGMGTGDHGDPDYKGAKWN